MVENGRIRAGAHAAVLLAWIGGWILTWSAAQTNLYFEPTNEALKAAHDAVPKGILGSCILLGAAILRLAYRPWPGVVLFALLPGWLLVTFLADPHSLGSWVWTLLLVPAGIGVLLRGRVTDRRHRVHARSE